MANQKLFNKFPICNISNMYQENFIFLAYESIKIINYKYNNYYIKIINI